jgi:hypothetical protein
MESVSHDFFYQGKNNFIALFTVKTFDLSYGYLANNDQRALID